MKKMFVGFAMFMAMFLMVSCGGGENGCKTYYDCINSCYNDAHSNFDYCAEDCQGVATHEDLVNYSNYRYCQEDWEDYKDDGGSQRLEDYCAGERKKCGL